MHGHGGPAAVVRVVVPLTDALREHWRTAAWLTLAAPAAIATWTSDGQSPAALQSGAMAGRRLILSRDQ
jgi:hypothetical protein